MTTQYTQGTTTINRDIVFPSFHDEAEKLDISKPFQQNVKTRSGFGTTVAVIFGSAIFLLGESGISSIPEPRAQDTSATLELNFGEEIESGVTQEFADSQGQHFDFLSYTEEDLLDWHKWLEPEELVEFFEELLKLVTQISEGTEDAETLAFFFADWRETALINSEPDVLADIAEAERELDAGGGKSWSQIKKEIGL